MLPTDEMSLSLTSTHVGLDAPVGPVPRMLRFFFTDPILSIRYPKGLAVPLGINRIHVATTLRSLCNGNSAGTCYGNATEASKPDVLGVDLEAILEFLDDDAWVGKMGPCGGKMLRDHGFVVVEVSMRHAAAPSPGDPSNRPRLSHSNWLCLCRASYMLCFNTTSPPQGFPPRLELQQMASAQQERKPANAEKMRLRTHLSQASRCFLLSEDLVVLCYHAVFSCP